MSFYQYTVYCVLYAFFCMLIAVYLGFMPGAFVFAASAEDIQVLKISPADKRAVVKTPEGKMEVIKTGDVIKGSELKAQGAELRVVEIAEGRIIFEEKTDKGIETMIIRIEEDNSSKSKAQGSGLKKQRVERIRKTGEKEPGLYSPK